MEKIEYPEINATYQHYKGGRYRVITCAKHTETGEVLVIYQSQEFRSVHARPLESWNSPVVIDDVGNELERFVKIGMYESGLTL